MLIPLMTLAIGFTLFFVVMLLVRMRAEVLRRRVRAMSLRRAEG